jgi:hypothetical protein
MSGLLNGLQAASNAVAGNVSGPVDLLALLLRKAGVPVGDSPVGGSAWMASKGLTAPVQQGASQVAGETLGLLGPMAAVQYAPQIARGLLAVADNAAAPRTMNVGTLRGQRGAIEMPDYGMNHRPMTVDQGAATLDNLAPAFGDDIYGPNAAQYYGTGNAALDRETLRVLRAVKGNPNATVTVYRAVPADASQAAMNAGDWVTVNKRYALEHGEGFLGGKFKIIEQKVPASWLTTSADSFHEQGFYPKTP